MKKGQIYEAEVVRCDYPGRGIALYEGHEVGIRGALPGQKISFRLTKKRASRCEGILLEVLEKAPAEREPDCPHFPACGGCLYRGLPYEEQLRLKETQIRRLFEDIVKDPQPREDEELSSSSECIEDRGLAGGSFACECTEDRDRTDDFEESGDTQRKSRFSRIYEGIYGSPDEKGYRNKMEFTFGDEYKEGPMSLGMHKSGSFYDIITTDQCQIVDEDFRRILSAVLSYAKESVLPYYHRLTHKGYFRHLLIRRAATTGEILVSLVTSSQGEADMKAFCQTVLSALGERENRGKIVGILHTVNDSVADTIQNDYSEILWGKDYFYEKLLGLSFRITPFSFFQTNSRGAELLYSIVRDYTGDTKDRVIFDLYSGTGTIAQILAPVARDVTGVEIVAEAVEAARENAKENGLENCSFLCGDVLKVIDELDKKPDLIILDPPREGIHPKALPKIIAFGVKEIIYISCKASSLQRDLQVFQAAGYSVERMSLVDLFPGTGHVETVVLMTRST